MKIILGTLNTKISVIKGIFYTVIEFFFSGITPSSTGGQPVQLYYMTVDKIPMRKSYITLILNTVFFKLILAILGILVLVFNNSFIMNTHYVYKVFFVIGFLVDYETMLPNNYYSIGRYVITCCAADASYVGFFFKYDKKIDPDEWYEIEGTLEEFEDTKGFKHLAIVVDKIDIIDGMQQEQYVYPCYAYDNGKCAEVSKYNLN